MDTQQLTRSPGAGTVGRRIKVRTNFLEVLAIPRGTIAQYDVTITPEVPPRLNRKVFDRFVETHRDSDLLGTRPVYDGRKIMFSSKVLPFNARTFDIRLPEDGATVTSRRAPREFVLKLKKVNEINMSDLVAFINANGRRTDNCNTAINVLDLIVSYKTSIIYPTIRGSFFTQQGSQPISGGLEVWQGYYQSVRPTRGKMMINVDLSATAFYMGGSLVDVITRILGRRSPDDLRRGISERDLVKIERILKNVKIRDNHRAGNRRRFKIIRFTNTSASNTQFDRGDGSLTSVADYFYDTYNIRLNFTQLPCVIVRRDVYLPIEVCDVIEGQRYLRKLDDRQTSDMIKFTCQNPASRANRINQGIGIINYRNNENVLEFGLRAANDLTIVNARVLDAPTLQYHPSSLEAKFKPREGAWNLRDKKVATGATLGSWSVLAFGSEREMPLDAINAFIRELINTCQQTGMNIPNRTPPIKHTSVQRVETSLKEVWLDAGNTSKAQPQLIVCILPNTGTPLYAEIKRVCDTVIGVSSQCIQSRHMMQPKRQYCANVCLKINVKLGGMNAFLNPTNIPFITDKPTILMGADVTHPRPGSTGPSIASLCASMDAKASRYAATIRIQESRAEIIADLANMVKELLKTFYQTCARKPERILFYRDGVSESQFLQVVREEVAAVRAACQSLEANYKPAITFVVVQKRHHTRFFPLDRRDSDRSGNCLPGTVVDTEITHPFEFDFYLQSHAGIQGTSRPTHYHVLLDQNGFSANGLQSLSYNLCYLYARCTRSVSLVPPVYYANLVCARARFHSSSWSETESSEETAGSVSTFGVVKPELQRIMYYM